MVKGAAATKEKPKENFETSLANLATGLSKELESKNYAPESKSILHLIGEEKNFWRSDPKGGLTLYFPPDLKSRFEELETLLKENGIGAKISKDELGDAFIKIGANVKRPELTGEAQALLERAETAISEAPEIGAAKEKPAAAPEKKKEESLLPTPKPTLPKKLAAQEQELMAHLGKLISQAKEIKELQYKAGREKLELFLKEHEKLAKLMEAKGVSEPVRGHADFLLRAANTGLWKRYAERISAALAESEALSAKASVSQAYQLWRNAEFEKRYGVSYESVKGAYDVYKSSYDTTVEQKKAGEIDELTEQLLCAEALKGLVENVSKNYERLASPKFKAAFMAWAKKTYGPKTPEYKEVVGIYTETTANLKKIFATQSKKLKEHQKEVARLAKEKAETPLTVADIQKWAGSNALSLEYLNKNQGAVAAMLPFVGGRDLGKILQQIDAASAALMGARALPSEPVRVPVGGAKSEKDYETVARGITALYSLRGLGAPEFSEPITAQRENWKGKKVLRVVSKPVLYSRPDTKNILPAAGENGVFITHKGRTIWISKEQKEGIENSLRTTNVGQFVIMKYGLNKVDVGGAELLADYLRLRGWENVSTLPWAGEGTVKARLSIRNVPANYWEKPTAAEMKKASRAHQESDIFAAVGEIEIPEEVLDARIDLNQPEYAAAFRKLTEEQKKYIKSYYVLSENDIFKQRQQLEAIATHPKAEGTPRAVFFNSREKAVQAADLLQAALNSRGFADINVYVERYGAFRGLEKHFGGYFLVVGDVLSNAFADRGEVPIRVPNFQTRETNMLLKNPQERSRLEAMLNNPMGGTEVFFLDKTQVGALEEFCLSIGFPWDSSVTYTRVKHADVPETERDFLWDKDSPAYSLVISTKPMVSEVPAEERGIRLQNLGNKLMDLQLNKGRFDAIMRQAKFEQLPKEDKVFKFRDDEGGAKTARAVHDALNASGLADVSYDGQSTVIIRQAEKKAPSRKIVKPLVEGAELKEEEFAMRGGAKQFRKATEEYLNMQRPMIVSGQEMDPQEIELIKELIRATDPEAASAHDIELSFSVAESPGDVREVFAEGREEDQRTYNSLYTAAFYLQQSFWRWNRGERFNKTVVNQLMNFGKLAEGTDRFSPDASIRVMREYALMHSGPGVKKNKAFEKRYAAKMSTMHYLLEQFGSFEEFSRQVGDPSAVLGLMHGAQYMADTICSKNIDFHTWSPAEQERYREAVFETSWRTVVAIMAYEGGGPRPKFDLPSMETEPDKYKAYQQAYGKILTEWLAGKSEFSTFTEGGTVYRSYDRVVVTSDGTAYLTVPIPNDPKHVEAVKQLVHKASPEGVYYYEYMDIAPEKRRVFPADSIGPVGATHKYRVGAYNVGYDYKLIKPPKPIPAPIAVWPQANAGKEHVMRDWVIRWDEAVLRIRPTKEELYSKVISKPMLRTVAVVIDTDSETGERSAFFHPPRHRYDSKGKEEPEIDYSKETDYYASFYADDDGRLYVFERTKGGPAYPGDAGKYYGMSEDKLAKEGVKRVEIGSYDYGKGTITFKEGQKEKYEQHLYGQWPIEEGKLAKMSKEDVEKEGLTHYNRFNYYRITDADLGAYGDIQALGPETKIKTPFSRKKTERTAILHLETNIPWAYNPKENE